MKEKSEKLEELKEILRTGQRILSGEEMMLLFTEAEEICNEFFAQCNLNNLNNVKDLVQVYEPRNPFVAGKILEELINRNEPEAVSAVLETGIYSDTGFLKMREIYIHKACLSESYESLIPLIEYCNELGFSVEQKKNLYKTLFDRAFFTKNFLLLSSTLEQFKEASEDEVDFKDNSEQDGILNEHAVLDQVSLVGEEEPFMGEDV